MIPPGMNVSKPKPLSSQIIKVIASMIPKIRANKGVRSLGELVMLNIKNLSVSMITWFSTYINFELITQPHQLA
jgi:hypothetical protein